MSSTRFVDAGFLKRFVILCGVVPGALLVWDAWQGNLGVNSVNYAIRSTGMIGLVFLTLSLAITPLRQLTKWNILISARRNLGVYGFGYILTHFLIFVVWDRDLDLGSTLTEIIEREYLWFGFGALLLMIPLAVTSTDGMVTRLGAKRWKALHRLAYVAVLGGVVHFYLLVKSDTRRPIAFAVAFGALMVYRVVRSRIPERKRFWSGEVVVAQITRETHDVKTFRFALPAGGRLPFVHTAGQYINLALMIDGKRVNRSYTIASSPKHTRHVEITVKRAANGYASHHLHDTVKEGDRIKVSAPAGKFVFAGHEAKRIVMLAGGVGITPMISIIRTLTARGWSGQMYLVYSVRTQADVIFADELEGLRKRFPNLRVHIVLSQERGHITRELLEGVIPDLRRGPILMCGPTPMMQAMRKVLVAGLGIPDGEVLEEVFVSPTSVATATEPGVISAAALVRFARSGQSADIGPEQTLLDVAESCGVDLPFECRSGICGQCKTKLVSGSVAMDAEDALGAADRANGLVLACQARAVTDLVVDA